MPIRKPQIKDVINPITTLLTKKNVVPYKARFPYPNSTPKIIQKINANTMPFVIIVAPGNELYAAA